MNNFKKSSLVLACLLLFGATAVLCACDPNPSEDSSGGGKTPPAVDYAVDESLIGSVDPNDEQFAPENVQTEADHPLRDKTVYWLGSSVTYGSAAQGDSMADFLAAKTGCTVKKDAVSGTTIYDDGGTGDSGARSYTRRLTESTVFDKTEHVDAFICQISTNDATNARLDKWGSVSDSDLLDKDDFDRGTTLGGVEYIVAYVTETWDCPVYFYSGAYFGDEGARKNTNPKGSNYGKLVAEVQKVADKWNSWYGYEVGIIDMYNDEAFNAAVSDEYYEWCMSDAIHPKRAGYLQWWMPYFENYLMINLEAF